MHRELTERNSFQDVIKIQGKARESISCKNEVSKTSPVKPPPDRWLWERIERECACMCETERV